ncbi:MAG: STAS domain-containing protein [Gemmatimonadaceae bacterium]
MSTSAAAAAKGGIARVLADHEGDLLRDWMGTQVRGMSSSAVSSAELKADGAEFLQLLRQAASAASESLDAPAWRPMRDFLERFSRTCAQQGLSPSETATFVLSLKEPLFSRIREAAGTDAVVVATDTWTATRLLDTLGLYTTEVHQRAREEVISRQQQDMLDLSTPVVTLWDGILALPMIGTLDSSRTQVVMETLLQRIVETGSDIAIIDITGVPTVDTLTAQHLLKTVTAARLMGAECIISGIRPQIAQTIVHLGIDLTGVATKATLADAFRLALQRSGRTVVKMGDVTAPAAAAPRDGRG